MPLNQVMGTEANVRILRVLCDRRVPISAAELARQAQLQRSTVSRTLRSLEQSRVVDYVGVAPQAQVALRDQSIVVRAIRQLFAAERKRFEMLLEGLKRGAARATPPPYAVWIGGGAAVGADRPGDTVDVYVLDEPERVALAAQLLRVEAERLEKKLDLALDVHEVTFADLATADFTDAELSDAVVIAGVPPLGFRVRARDGTEKDTKARRRGSHADLEALSLARARDLASAIRKDPAIIQRARKYVDRRWRSASPGERKELAEWRRILRTSSPAAIGRILTATDERSARLRQTLPFIGVLQRE